MTAARQSIIAIVTGLLGTAICSPASLAVECSRGRQGECQLPVYVTSPETGKLEFRIQTFPCGGARSCGTSDKSHYDAIKAPPPPARSPLPPPGRTPALPMPPAYEPPDPVGYAQPPMPAPSPPSPTVPDPVDFGPDPIEPGPLPIDPAPVPTVPAPVAGPEPEDPAPLPPESLPTEEVPPEDVTPPPPSAPCDLPWGGQINDGDYVKAYLYSNPKAYTHACDDSGGQYEYRTCHNGALDNPNGGNYIYQTCTADKTCDANGSGWNIKNLPEGVVDLYNSPSFPDQAECKALYAHWQGTCSNGQPLAVPGWMGTTGSPSLSCTGNAGGQDCPAFNLQAADPYYYGNGWANPSCSSGATGSGSQPHGSVVELYLDGPAWAPEWSQGLAYVCNNGDWMKMGQETVPMTQSCGAPNKTCLEDPYGWSSTSCPSVPVATLNSVDGNAGFSGTTDINGYHFTGTTGITIGGQAISSFTVINDTKISIAGSAFPCLGAGTYHMTITNGTGASAAWAHDQWTYDGSHCPTD